MGRLGWGNGDLCSWGWGFLLRTRCFVWKDFASRIEVVEREYESGGLHLPWKCRDVEASSCHCLPFMIPCSSPER